MSIVVEIDRIHLLVKARCRSIDQDKGQCEAVFSLICFVVARSQQNKQSVVALTVKDCLGPSRNKCSNRIFDFIFSDCLESVRVKEEGKPGFELNLFWIVESINQESVYG